ncbi:uncharacterized protein LOC128236638 [Mya arenaria]|uniref:uncharacterized protein LOC128236638 n=1 Tax=Mya arenaria TaxID=6604 RepID=UPI0022E26A9E|nr:uncharacterized protein LOC128236638 [Mya arenaria]
MFLQISTLCCVFSQLLASESGQQKRVLLHNDDDLLAIVHALQAKVSEQDAKISTLQAQVASPPTGQGSTYIRWGRTVCPSNGTELVYKGFAAGNWFNWHGGAADYICLTQDPIWGVYEDGANLVSAKIYGTEYEFGEHYSDGGAKFFGSNLYEHDVPCALCHSSRPATVMIPGRNQCYPGWTLEYSGYLVSGRNQGTYDVSATNYACLDTVPESEFGDNQNNNGKLMVLVEAQCGSLKCPPYVQNREITCVVCSK